jgi:uncharacterized protein YdiU (UPF0061 family)
LSNPEERTLSSLPAKGAIQQHPLQVTTPNWGQDSQAKIGSNRLMSTQNPSIDPSLQFTNRYADQLPADPENGSRRRQIQQACFSRVMPTAVQAPALLAYSAELASQLDLSPSFCDSTSFAEVFSGNKTLPGMDPHATCYGGHQFGNWAGQLGDGRAINLGEVRNTAGEHWMLQLKGAGPTPYSRTADGLAVLRSSVREFLCSEAMYHLGVPTTRALSLTLTGEQVLRDMLYDGNAAHEPGAVVCRAAPSFTRFGHFEILASRQEETLLRQFIDVTIRNDFPELVPSTAGAELDTDTHLAWFREVCQRTLQMVLHWQRVGFVHGVMNTDNMSILGLTIDYGPYGWLEDYDPNWTPNTTDAANRRYRFGQQAAMAQWNLLQLANAIFPIVPQAKALEAELTHFAADYERLWQQTHASKIGLQNFDPSCDAQLLTDLELVLQQRETDMTLFYRQLAQIDISSTQDQKPLLNPAYYPSTENDAKAETQQAALNRWLDQYSQRLRHTGQDQTQRRAQMNQVNPLYVLRNYLAQVAIDRAEQGDYAGISELLEIVRQPYIEQPQYQHAAQLRPDWARTRVGCSMLSCSS